MTKRPIYVTIIGWLYIVMGVVGFAYHFSELAAPHAVAYDAIWVELVRLVAVVSGMYLLRGHNWARWLAVAWIGFHVILSAFHTLPELAVHAVFFAMLAYLLFRPTATRYFQAAH